jgi:hypothetical protein
MENPKENYQDLTISHHVKNSACSLFGLLCLVEFVFIFFFAFMAADVGYSLYYVPEEAVLKNHEGGRNAFDELAHFLDYSASSSLVSSPFSLHLWLPALDTRFITSQRKLF